MQGQQTSANGIRDQSGIEQLFVSLISVLIEICRSGESNVSIGVTVRSKTVRRDREVLGGTTGLTDLRTVP